LGLPLTRRRPLRRAALLSPRLELRGLAPRAQTSKVGNRENRFSDLPGVLPQLSRSYNARDWLAGDSYDSNGNTVSGSILDTNSLLSAPSGTDVYDFENRLTRKFQE
jgi:hypothetical protein